MKAHPLAEIFPGMVRVEFVELLESIRRNGLINDIVTYDGQILDGVHRHKACCELGIEPRFREYTGDDPIGHVVALNLERRHLDGSQRAMIAGRVATLRKGRPGHVPQAQLWAPGDGADLGTRQGRRSAAAPSPDPTDRSVKMRKFAHFPDQPQSGGSHPVTTADAAAALHVSPRSVQHAQTVLRHGSPELIAQVDRGEVSVSAAARQARPPERPATPRPAAPVSLGTPPLEFAFAQLAQTSDADVDQWAEWARGKGASISRAEAVLRIADRAVRSVMVAQ